MIALIGMVLLLQTIFYWILKPAINLATPFLELRGLDLFLLIVGAWILSGRGHRKDPF